MTRTRFLPAGGPAGRIQIGDYLAGVLDRIKVFQARGKLPEQIAERAGIVRG